jgi:hypothetical protein
MRAIPSPTVSTVPVSTTAAALSKFWMFFLIIWLISSARSCILGLGCEGMNGSVFGEAAGSAGRLRNWASSWSRIFESRVRMEPSTTLSPMRVTTPPSIVGSTAFSSTTFLPVARSSCSFSFV